MTTRPIPYGEVHGVPLSAVQWLASDLLTLAVLPTAPIFGFFRSAAEGDTAIAECPPIPARRERKSARPGITATRSPGK